MFLILPPYQAPTLTMVPMVRVRMDTDLSLHGNHSNNSLVPISFTNLRITAPIKMKKFKDAGLHQGKFTPFSCVPDLS